MNEHEKLQQIRLILRTLIEGHSEIIEESHVTWIRKIYANINRRIAKIEAAEL